MPGKKTQIGVLALQGAFELHKRHIEALGAIYVPVVSNQNFEKLDGLIIPGGESGTMLKLINIVNIHQTLNDFLHTKPIWGICAGAILLAKSVQNPTQESFGILDFEITRNAYGRQLESFQEKIDDYEVSYIRAPKISKVGDNISVIKEREGSATWLESNKIMITTFHPETNLSTPSPWHRRFIECCNGMGEYC